MEVITVIRINEIIVNRRIVLFVWVRCLIASCTGGHHCCHLVALLSFPNGVL